VLFQIKIEVLFSVTLSKINILGSRFINWLLFTVLSLIWGSSFLLMKIGMEQLSPYEVAALRILSAGIVLIPFAFKAFKQIPRNKIGLALLSGLMGSFIPAFFFCLAETKLDSALTGMLNSLTPLCAVIIGTLFFKMKPTAWKFAGIFIGLIGLFFLVSPNGQFHFNNANYISLIILATILYAINANFVSKSLGGLGPLNIASVAFALLIIPCLMILAYVGYFSRPLGQLSLIKSTAAACILGTGGTAIATILLYRLIKRAGALFATMVTYGIPFVAAGWGVVYGERVTLFEIGCLGIILSGVYLANK